MAQKSSIRGVFNCLMLFILIPAVTLSVLACFGAYNENCELLTHFRFQYLVVSILFLVSMLIQKKMRWIAIALAWFIYCVLPIAPYYIPYNHSPNQLGTRFKILQLNVLLDNPHHQKIVNLINREKPDIIGLEEVRLPLVTGLRPIEKDYPYRIIVPESSAFGVALYSKYPLTDEHIEHFGKVSTFANSPIPTISALIQIDNEPIRLIVTHPFPPTLFDLRNKQLASMAAARTQFEPNLIIMGDLNSSPWSPYFQSLINKTGLHDSSLGMGVQPSWPTEQWWIRTPIDHILVSDKIQVLKRYIGPDIGSDHLPVLAEIALNKSL